jgi:BirA family biotin operon repressor/biotin-[acetyl-CoA-carboxylase] ligase
MNEHSLRKTLAKIPLGGLRYYEQTGSTNDAALAWAAEGAPDLALVYSEEQTAGRGRLGRRWFTPAGTALAFSLIMQPVSGEEQSSPLVAALGALAVCEALEALGLQPAIKWPNDVLLNRRKVCGILAEAVWLGDRLESIVLGVGVNIMPESIPPPEQLNYPATCLEAELAALRHATQPVDRLMLLEQILESILLWRDRMVKDVFLHSLEKRLAFRGEPVEIQADGQPSRPGQVDGLDPDGSLRLLSPQGQAFSVHVGEIHLHPVV